MRECAQCPCTKETFFRDKIRFTCKITVSNGLTTLYYTMFLGVQRYEECNIVYGTVHYKEPLETCSPDLGLPCVAIYLVLLSWSNWFSMNFSIKHVEGFSVYNFARYTCFNMIEFDTHPDGNTIFCYKDTALLWNINWGGRPRAVVEAACLETRRSRVSNPTLTFKFQRMTLFLPRSCKDSILWGACVTER